MTPQILEILKRTGALACLDCGKCTSVCPVARHEPFSPRMAVTVLSGGTLDGDSGIWECLTCDRCNLECPSDVHFADMVGLVRRLAFDRRDFTVPCAHGGALQSMMRLSADPGTRPDRLDWIPEDARVAEKGEVLYFVGCLPHFEVFFEDLEVHPLATARASLKLLNAVGVAPVVLPDERCCGHDLLWSGDEKTFEALARLNIEAIHRSGAKVVVFSCAEGYQVFRSEIAERFGPLDFMCVHITEFLASKVADMPLKPRPGKVTYHDPCRLGRFGNVFSSPRALIEGVPELELVEMPRNREKAACCGTTLWASCGGVSRALQTERLVEAASTGAELLVTACPKCRIHFACARLGDEGGEVPSLPVKDVTELLAEALEPDP